VDSAEAAGEGGVKIKAKDPAHILKKSSRIIFS
jgi:hypothetical protein